MRGALMAAILRYGCLPQFSGSSLICHLCDGNLLSSFSEETCATGCFRTRIPKLEKMPNIELDCRRACCEALQLPGDTYEMPTQSSGTAIRWLGILLTPDFPGLQKHPAFCCVSIA